MTLLSFSFDMPMISLAAVTMIQNQGSDRKSIGVRYKGLPSFACEPVADNTLLYPSAYKDLCSVF